MARLAALAMLLALSLTGTFAFLGHRLLQQPFATRSPKTELKVVVAQGASLRSTWIAWEKQGWIDEGLWSARIATWLPTQTSIQAGAYLFERNTPLSDVLAKMVAGQVQTQMLTIIEGWNRWDVAQRLADEGWMSQETFDSLCDDPKFLSKMGLLDTVKSCEGYLFPETYRLALGTPPADVLAIPIKRAKTALKNAQAQIQAPLALNPQEFLTLASIVEKETGAAHERPNIACVFYNRLQAKPAWKLQTDPTVIYAAKLSQPNFDGNITRAHLRRPHPYNTYAVMGLPPGPIANPGKAALDAVAKPTSCSDFFFVSKNDGTHVFCPDLACHQKAVQKWQVRYFRSVRRGKKPKRK